MDEQMIADIAKAICCASPCEGCKGHGEGGCFELDMWSREARAAHSVMAGRVAELEAERDKLKGEVAFLTALQASQTQPRGAALAPHPKGME